MYPFPKINGTWHCQEGSFSVPQTLQVSCGPFESYCLEAFCTRMGLPMQAGEPWLMLKQDASLPEEAYRLEILPSGIRIAAATERGVIWALTTAYQLCENGCLPCCRISDAPRYPHRGQSFDCVRHFFAIEEVMKVVEQMARVKMNVLHFHLTDDQGWRIESLRFPQLHGVNPDYYTQAQLKQLIQFARVRGVEVVPEIDLPGHTTSVLTAFPELGCTGKPQTLGKVGGVYTTILCGGSEAVYDFLDKLLEEVCAIFPAKRFHIGGDEAPKGQWKTCPVCQAKLEQLGSSDFEHLQGYFTRRVADILKKYGKTPICWNESLKCGELPQDMQIQYWTLDDLAKMQTYIAGGGKFIYSYMLELYLDYPYSMSWVKKLHRLKPHIWYRMCMNDPGMIGMESTLWAEHIDNPKSVQEHLLPRMYIVAEKAWCGGHRTYRQHLQSLHALCDAARKEGLAPMDAGWWNPRGKGRREEALDFCKKMNGGVLDEELPDNLERAQPNAKFMFDYVTRFFRLSDLPALYKLYFR